MTRRRSEQDDYLEFTGPMRLSKAVHTLEGLLIAFHADKKVTPAEFDALRQWLEEHRPLSCRHPFNEVYPALDRAMSDGVLDSEELEDVLWLCGKLKPAESYYTGVTADMQRLQGILAGIVADGRVDDSEIEQLAAWLENTQHLKTCWPFDEVESLLVEVRKDRKIEDHERQLLLAFLSEFTTILGKRAINFPANEVNVPITGLCAVCPELKFRNKLFSFTGKSSRLSRAELVELVEGLGGKFWPRITAEVHYLIIGADGNPCWAYACYGRKVEQAITLRKAGNPLLLVHENDFWDAVEGCKANKA